MFDEKVITCILNEDKRYLLKGIPVCLIASIDYEPDWFEWQIILKAERN